MSFRTPIEDRLKSAVLWHRINLLDPAVCAEAIATIRPTDLLHLAWIATPGVFWNSSENLRWLVSSIELVQAFCKQGGRRVLGIGTCAEYEWGHDTCVEASTPLKPSTIYGRCKLSLALATEAVAEANGISAAWARLFFPYGPGEPADRLIPSVIRGLLRRERVSCTHGRQIRDFVFVEDVADALVTLLESSAIGSFNVGSGEPSSLRDVVSIITARLGHPELIQFGSRPTPPNDPDQLVADIGRLQRELGWRPKISFEQGIDRTIAAYRSEPHSLAT